jgi:hypothetical protein
MNKMNVQELEAIGAAVLAGFLGCGIMLLLPSIGESTAAMVGAAAAVAGWKTVMSQHGKAYWLTLEPAKFTEAGMTTDEEIHDKVQPGGVNR